MPIMRTYIAGTVYKDAGRKLMHKLPANTMLRLKAEPENPFDKNAVAVYVEDPEAPNTFVQLGYVPKVDAPTIVRVLKADYAVHTRLMHNGLTSIEITWGEN